MGTDENREIAVEYFVELRQRALIEMTTGLSWPMGAQ